ncbi:MAG: hypothetical protein IT371_25820 [Deltaproteobacteria bacterium]|nr:hypothetical protein [Deltaproteobacteria bacterium]
MRALWLTGPLVWLVACGSVRDRQGPSADQPSTTYLTDLQPLFVAKCVSCHSGAAPKGSYDLSSWRGLLGPGADQLVRNVIPGDAASLLVTKVGPASDETHKALLTAAELERLTTWVVKDRAAYFVSKYHPAGWLDPSDRAATTFHGGALRAKGWDRAECQKCHGADDKGGKAGRACATCHADGVDSCSTCHSDGKKPQGAWADLKWNLDPEKRGAGVHAAHLKTTVFAALECKDCHKVPEKVTDDGHLFDDATARTSDFRAEVSFSERASGPGLKASYDAETGTCTTWCHGAGFSKPTPKPTWASKPTNRCSPCHAVPAVAGGLDCTTCHPQSVELCKPGEPGCLEPGKGVGLRFKSPTMHGDGKYPLGKAGLEGTCYACHGTKESNGAPAPDLHGSTDPKQVTIGLHETHLKQGRYRPALSCDTCHQVPTKLTDKGHLDSDLPAEVTFGPLATGASRGVTTNPTWDRTKGTCSNVACHALDGGDGGKDWPWTSSLTGGLSCTACHGQPPKTTARGAAHPQVKTCDTCHAPAYTGPGGSLDPTKHLNGTVEVAP